MCSEDPASTRGQSLAGKSTPQEVVQGAHHTQDKQNAAPLLRQCSERQRSDPPSGSMQYWREEQSPCGVSRGCCRLLQQEKEGNSIEIQRQEETTSSWHPAADCKRVLAIPWPPSEQANQISRTATSNRLSGPQREEVKRNPRAVAWGKTSNLSSQGVLALPPASFISPQPLQVETGWGMGSEKRMDSMQSAYTTKHIIYINVKERH